MKPIIEIKNLTKEYTLFHKLPYYTLRDTLTNIAKKPLDILQGKNKAQDREKFLALNNINLEINEGERVGIIGRNGAGKSTLLKILSQITPPTAGEINLRGRVASLLEVGTGFHPELTGRENIYLNGAILGMKQKEIAKKFDEIVDFSEIEKFLDTPVKRYSSGMYVRLAFAVAAHLEPEILIVDEVLAVGDAQFQKKCLGKMNQISREGRTILFVSHNMSAIASLCDRCVVLNQGEKMLDGEVASAINFYLSNAVQNIFEKSICLKSKKPQILKAWLGNKDGVAISQIINGEPVILFIHIENQENNPVEISLSFFDHLKRPLWNFTHAMHNIPIIPAGKEIKAKITFYPPKFTVPEIYTDIAIGPKGGYPFYDHIIDALKFSVIEQNDVVALPRFPDWPILCPAKLNYEIIKE